MSSKKYLTPVAMKRCLDEKRKLDEESSEMNFVVHPVTNEGENAYRVWDIFILGYENTLYEGKVLHAQIEIPKNYPNNPPKMRFISKMYHPNVYEDGRICISILTQNNDDVTGYIKTEDTWTPIQGFRTIILSVVSILNEPNCDSPANIEAGRSLREKPEEYANLVKSISSGESEKAEEKLRVLGLHSYLYSNKK